MAKAGSFRAGRVVVAIVAGVVLFAVKSHVKHSDDDSVRVLPPVLVPGPTPKGTASFAATGSLTPPPSQVALSAVPAPLVKTDLTTAEKAYLQVLDDLLQARNDNDPRWDRDFRELTPGFRQVVQEKYRELPAESRNQRGSLVFILGRELKSQADVEFLAQVMAEPPCLSMESCQRLPPHAVDEHASMANETTLSYPQLVAIKSCERVMKAGAKDGPVDVAGACQNLLQQASQSPQARLSRAANAALGR